MDDLTRERYPDGVPWVERRRRPAPKPADWGLILERRLILDEALKNPGVSEYVQPPNESDPRDMVSP